VCRRCDGTERAFFYRMIRPGSAAGSADGAEHRKDFKWAAGAAVHGASVPVLSLRE
jgi:hypothetical protein